MQCASLPKNDLQAPPAPTAGRGSKTTVTWRVSRAKVWLGAVGPRPKRFAGNVPAVVKPASGRISLLATNAEIYGDQIAFESPFRNIGLWHGTQDHVLWMLDLEKPGQFDVWLDWACDDAV